MKDMLASLPQLRDAKDKLSLHLTMAEKCMALFEKKKLPLSASVEQVRSVFLLSCDGTVLTRDEGSVALRELLQRERHQRLLLRRWYLCLMIVQSGTFSLSLLRNAIR